MCGRARCTLRADDIPRACHRSDASFRSVNMDRYRPSYNVSPGWNLPVVYRGSGSSGGDGYSIHCMTWGLIPSFTKKTEKPDFYKMFNARSESVGEKASFRRLLPKSRCLVAVEGFYEWKKDGSKKQPYYIHFRDGRPLVFAALYDSWQNAEGEILYTFTILTTSSSSALQWLHDRMPVVLGDKGAVDTWLDGSSSLKLDDVLKPYENSDLVWYPVTPAMGKTSFNGPECIKEIRLKTENKSTISKFFTRKDIKGDHESTLKESTADKSVNMDHPDTVKVEYKAGDPSTVTSDLNLKSDVSMIPHENATKRQTPDPDSKSSVSKSYHDDEAVGPTKCHHEEPLAETELDRDEDAKQQQSPPRKKAHLKTASDKQSTLLSYFSKR